MLLQVEFLHNRNESYAHHRMSGLRTTSPKTQAKAPWPDATSQRTKPQISLPKESGNFFTQEKKLVLTGRQVKIES